MFRDFFPCFSKTVFLTYPDVYCRFLSIYNVKKYIKLQFFNRIVLAVFQSFSTFVLLLPFDSRNFWIFFSDFFVDSLFSQKCNFKSWKCLYIFFFAVDVSFYFITVWYDTENYFDSFVLIFWIILSILWPFHIFIFIYMKHIYTYPIHIHSLSLPTCLNLDYIHSSTMSQWIQLIAAYMCMGMHSTIYSGMSYLSTVISWKKTKYTTADFKNQ